MRAYAVLHFMGWVLAALSAAMAVPTVFAFAADSLRIAQAFIVPAFLVGFLGGCLILAFRGRQVFSSRWESLLLLGLVWLVVPLAAALPFYTAEAPKGLVPAYFEAVSGFTTTGATALADLAQAPHGVIVWRAVLQWTGGLTTLFSLIAILGPLSGPYMLDRQLRLVGRSTHGSTRHMLEAIRSVTPLYTALTLVCYGGLALAGVPAFDAFCLAMSTVSTGGFMPREGTIAMYGLPAAELCLAVFMVAGAVSIVWVRALVQRRWMLVRETREPFWILALVVAFAAMLYFLAVGGGAVEAGWASVFRAMTAAVATAASIVSTSGFPVSAPLQELIPYIVFAGLAFLGAGRLSTGGGLKVYRAVTMLRQSRRELRILVYPHSVRPARYDTEEKDIEHVRVVWITFAAFVIAAGVLALLVAASGVRFSGAILAGIGALCNVGPVYEMARAAHFPEAPAYAGMTPFAHLVLCFAMIAGRVEILALLTLFNIANWRG